MTGGLIWTATTGSGSRRNISSPMPPARGTPDPAAARAFHVAANDRLPGSGREVLQSQVEVSTPPGTDFAEARDRLAVLRSELAGIGRERGLLVFASGTHPVAAWSRQEQSEGDRYDRMVPSTASWRPATWSAPCMSMSRCRIPDAAPTSLRRMVPYVPMFLALSVSSPFWEARETGLAGYRMAAYREWPRSGLPDLMDGAADYEHYLQVMTQSGAIPDASYLWWALRPSMHYPTLELRVCDSCVHVGDSVAIAALLPLRGAHARPKRTDIHAEADRRLQSDRQREFLARAARWRARVGDRRGSARDGSARPADGDASCRAGRGRCSRLRVRARASMRCARSWRTGPEPTASSRSTTVERQRRTGQRRGPEAAWWTWLAVASASQTMDP